MLLSCQFNATVVVRATVVVVADGTTVVVVVVVGALLLLLLLPYCWQLLHDPMSCKNGISHGLVRMKL